MCGFILQDQLDSVQDQSDSVQDRSDSESLSDSCSSSGNEEEIGNDGDIENNQVGQGYNCCYFNTKYNLSNFSAYSYVYLF